MYDVTINQSGAIPFFLEDKVIKYVLIRSNHTKTFVFPKGMIEVDLTPQQSAAQEALEEAGLTGDIFQEATGRYEYNKYGLDFTVDLFPLYVEEILDTWEEPWRDRQIVDYSNALKCIDEKLKDILVSFHPLAYQFIQNRLSKE